jgi:hypothetical protein
MTDNEVIQDLFDTFAVVNKLTAIVNVEEFLAGRHGLLDYGPKADSNPAHVLSCVQRIYKSIGPRLFKAFVMLEDVRPSDGLDDAWAHWCPLPPDVALHTQDYPAGAIPLWSNGTRTVICRLRTDEHGNEEFDFGVC